MSIYDKKLLGGGGMQFVNLYSCHLLNPPGHLLKREKKQLLGGGGDAVRESI
jgi:hypothetical protein